MQRFISSIFIFIFLVETFVSPHSKHTAVQRSLPDPVILVVCSILITYYISIMTQLEKDELILGGY